MKRLTFWALFLCLMTAVTGLAAQSELRVPSIKIGVDVYSNAVITPSVPGRVSATHPWGVASIKIAQLEVELAQQLLQAGVVTEEELKGNTNYQAHLKEEKLAAKQREQAGKPQGPVAKFGGMEGSMGAALSQRLESEANAHGGIDPQKYIAMLGVGVVLAILGAAVLFYFLRCWCLFRIVKKSLGQGSLLVFLPLFRWFPLLRAAGMSLHLLWIPTFGLVMLYFQPPFPEQVAWMPKAYHLLTLGLWVVTALLFAVWCVKICQRAGRSPLLGLFLLLPLFEWVALLYLALSGDGSSEGRPHRAAGARPVFVL